MTADLVVDASGRSSRTPQWLTSIGAPAPAEERVETGVAYATRLYRARLDPAVADYRGIYLLPHPSVARGAVVLPIEVPDHFLVTLTGSAGDEPPTDPAGFEAFAARLEDPIVSQWLAGATAQGPAMGFRSTATVRRRYDGLDGPDGLLVVGDATASFNPVYGQGVSVAALGAQAVARALAKGRRSARHLQKEVMRAGAQAWSVSSGVDKTLPGAVSVGIRTSVADRVAGWYLDRVEAISVGNPVVGDAFLEVIHLVAPASRLFAWPVLRPVLFGRTPAPITAPPLKFPTDRQARAGAQGG
jgi:2-polyprenyl-6-methoxyphenol hydroxylase-like FAD-dependent oxidoreductase